MYTATIQNITLHYDRLGSGEPLLLLHGMGERKEGWVWQHELADEYDLIIPDLRGHGQSRQTEDISVENCARDILALLDHLGIGKAHICGFSMGGLVAQEMYRLEPDRCRSLILVSTYHYIPECLRPVLFGMYMWKHLFLPRFIRMRLTAFTCLYSWDETTIQRFHQTASGDNCYKKIVSSCVAIDNRNLLSKIEVPTLIAGSEYDLITPSWIQMLMHKSIAGSELVIFPKAGHMSKLEKPDEFNRSLRRFLNRNRLQPRSTGQDR
ncbi:alpha/beta fold hydrolase [Effusibacillus lacus]|uniref:Alpha/beta hydrolase n=1 Tax=Effusibacillus lacus TaxID=1348429 RepID=A0A292YPC1_9BACL|nr:alpha/beta hydrolase [Effusibacillus lacus]TCS71116.1 pimeloyl-ACP methyl ester carboxylesterase [Effusibacillus lacus]GAX90759.1 alpha/beta hydrolase [Effusibacillus lacus]